MTVYVDELTKCIPTKEWPFMAHAKMFGTDVIELHRIARMIGLKQKWYRTDIFPNHYEITAAKRRAAIQLGAVPKKDFQIVKIFREARLRDAS